MQGATLYIFSHLIERGKGGGGMWMGRRRPIGFDLLGLDSEDGNLREGKMWAGTACFRARWGKGKASRRYCVTGMGVSKPSTEFD
jgi:hypothetical protein